MEPDSFYSSKIYKITCYDSPNRLVYLGVTNLSLDRVMLIHERLAKVNKEGIPLYKAMAKFKQWRIEKVADYPCRYKEDLLEREQLYMFTVDPNLNESDLKTHQENQIFENEREDYLVPVHTIAGAEDIEDVE